MNDYFYLGVVTKTFGYKGQVVIYLDTDEPEKYKTLDAVFIKEEDEMLPYMIEDFIYKGANQAILKFADVNGDEAKNLVRAELYLPLSFLPPLTGNKFYFHEVIGFDVIDKEKGNIGKCVDFMEVSRQPIMQVNYNGTEILIPAVDEIFETVDRDNKTITISAPDGLIDIYL
ncbi:MAG: ribosome maturation factor RimM [Bacteroidetes bacterium]|nr:ribosome maturation factor RimM [Bacteroidota bacterium]MCL2302250.1 ribosome maturation factor RimM [Lentimicrobiaceae bacterium]